MSATSYQIMPPLTPEERQALKEDIRKNGVLVPVEKDEHGNLLDGHHRVELHGELRAEGVELAPYPVIVRAGLTEEQKRAHVRSLNLNRRHLTREQRRQLIADQLKETPAASNNKVAAALGVDDKTVAAVRRDLEATSEIPKLTKTVGQDGKERPASRPRAAESSRADGRAESRGIKEEFHGGLTEGRVAGKVEEVSFCGLPVADSMAAKSGNGKAPACLAQSFRQLDDDTRGLLAGHEVRSDEHQVQQLLVMPPLLRRWVVLMLRDGARTVAGAMYEILVWDVREPLVGVLTLLQWLTCEELQRVRAKLARADGEWRVDEEVILKLRGVPRGPAHKQPKQDVLFASTEEEAAHA